MDTAGMLQPKNLEAATAQLAAYLLNYPPPPNDPRAGQHQVELESLGIIGNKIIPPSPAIPVRHHRSAIGGSPLSGGSHRRDARNDITQKNFDKARHQRSNRVGF